MVEGDGSTDGATTPGTGKKRRKGLPTPNKNAELATVSPVSSSPVPEEQPIAGALVPLPETESGFEGTPEVETPRLIAKISKKDKRKKAAALAAMATAPTESAIAESRGEMEVEVSSEAAAAPVTAVKWSLADLRDAFISLPGPTITDEDRAELELDDTPEHEIWMRDCLATPKTKWVVSPFPYSDIRHGGKGLILNGLIKSKYIKLADDGTESALCDGRIALISFKKAPKEAITPGIVEIYIHGVAVKYVLQEVHSFGPWPFGGPVQMGQAMEFKLVVSAAVLQLGRTNFNEVLLRANCDFVDGCPWFLKSRSMIEGTYIIRYLPSKEVEVTTKEFIEPLLGLGKISRLTTCNVCMYQQAPWANPHPPASCPYMLAHNKEVSRTGGTGGIDLVKEEGSRANVKGIPTVSDS